MRRKLFIASVAILLSVAAMRTTLADSNISFKNDSGKTLYIYYASAPNGTTIDCRALTFGGAFSPGANWSYSVGANKWGWVRFQENTENAGCSSNNSKFETRIAGSAENKSETVSVY